MNATIKYRIVFGIILSYLKTPYCSIFNRFANPKWLNDMSRFTDGMCYLFVDISTDIDNWILDDQWFGLTCPSNIGFRTSI